MSVFRDWQGQWRGAMGWRVLRDRLRVQEFLLGKACDSSTGSGFWSSRPAWRAASATERVVPGLQQRCGGPCFRGKKKALGAPAASSETDGAGGPCRPGGRRPGATMRVKAGAHKVVASGLQVPAGQRWRISCRVKRLLASVSIGDAPAPALARRRLRTGLPDGVVGPVGLEFNQQMAGRRRCKGESATRATARRSRSSGLA